MKKIPENERSLFPLTEEQFIQLTTESLAHPYKDFPSKAVEYTDKTYALIEMYTQVHKLLADSRIKARFTKIKKALAAFTISTTGNISNQISESEEEESLKLKKKIIST